MGVQPSQDSLQPVDTVTTADSWLGPATVQTDRSGAPTRIGRFTILELLGSGAMGVVFAGHDTQLDRKVAVKLLQQHRARDPDRARVRMVREAQAMARLSHPNVVQVYEADIHEDQVYIAMEFVDGMTLRHWERESGRGWREILGVYLQAGRGLAAAHREGLIHRDFKPENVLVSADGQAKVTDFGMARAAEAVDESGASSSASGPGAILEAWSTASESAHGSRGDASTSSSASVSASSSNPLQVRITRTGAVLGTPAYMAPEQFMREPITARSDQFSYCLSLYQALFGQDAFEGRDAHARAVAVTDGHPRPIPKGTAVPRRIQEAVLRGLSRQPEHRFPDMDALLEALSWTPRPGAAYVAGGALLVTGVVIAAALVGRQSPCEAAGEQLRGTWDDEVASRVATALESTGVPFATEAARTTIQTLDTYAEAWRDGNRQACEATHVRQTQSEALLDLRASCLATRRQELAALVEVLREPDALVVAEAPVAAASLPRVDVCANTEVLTRAPTEPEDPGVAAQVEATRTLIAGARALRTTGRHAEAIPAASLALERAEGAGHPPVIAAAQHELGLARAASGEVDPGVELLLTAVDGAEAVRHDALAARVWMDLSGLAPHLLGDTERGRAWVRRADAAVKRIGDAPLARAEVLWRRGNVAFAETRLDEAARALTEALELQRKHLGDDHLASAKTLSDLANVRAAQGDLPAAIAGLRGSLEIKIQKFGANHPATALAHFNLAGSLVETGALEEARGQLGLAMNAYDRDGADATLGRGRVHAALANLEAAAGDLSASRTHAERATALLDRSLPAAHPERADPLMVLGSVQLLDGDAGAAVDTYGQALAILREAHGDDHLEVGILLANLGEARLEAAEPEAARADLERALTILGANLPDGHPALATTRDLLARTDAVPGR